MPRAILRLALRRLRSRIGPATLLGGAVAAATVLTVVLFAISVVATDRAIGAALAALDDGERTIRASTFRPSGTDATAALGSLDASMPGDHTRAAIFRRVRTPGFDVDFQLLAVDGAARWVHLADGRAPAACEGRSCEAVVLSEAALPDGLPATISVGGIEARIVGRGVLASGIPLGRPDQSGAGAFAPDPYNLEAAPPPLLVLVDGLDAVAGGEALARVGRTYVATLPVDSSTVRASTVPTLQARVDGTTRALTAYGLDHTLTSPLGTIDAELARGRVADGRLLLVGSLAVAVLVAFAVFAAVLSRSDVQLELDRLVRAGAPRVQRGSLVLAEAAVPAAIGGLIGWLSGLAIGAALAAWQGQPAGSVVGAIGTSPAVLVVAGGVAGLVVVAVALAQLARPGRGTVVGLVPGLMLAGVLLAWGALAGGSLVPAALASSSFGPVVVLLPAGIAFALAVLVIGILPPILRRAARRAAGLPLISRLALLSLARQPGRPAATLGVLAFSLGALVFAVGYAATLRVGITDQAAFAAGTDLRVTEAGSGLTLSSTVVPFDRYAGLPAGAEASPVHRRTTHLPNGAEVELLGVMPSALSGLRGWRDDFSSLDPSELGHLIEVPGDFTLGGHDLAPDAREIAFTLALDGARVRLGAVIETRRGDFATVPLGTFTPGRHDVRADLPADAAGGRVIAIEIGDALAVAGPYHQGSLGTSTIAVSGLEGLVDATPRTLETKGLEIRRLVAPSPTEGIVLPAVVSADVAATAGPDGIVTLALTDRAPFRLRPVATTSQFPTIRQPGRAFAVVAIEPFLAAINMAAPGAGRPDEAWISAGGPGSPLAAEVETALSSPPFRTATVLSADRLEAARAADPFAAAVVWALIAASIAGLGLACLAIGLGGLADRRDEAGEFRDLEAQGLGPAAISRLAAVRTVGTSAVGVLIGVIVGLVLTLLVTRGLAVGADLATPVPDLRPAIPIVPIVLLSAIPIAIAWLASRTAGGRSRSGDPVLAATAGAAPAQDPRDASA